MAKQTIGEFLATLRKANGYTQQEVADRLGISNRTLSGWECNNVLPDILLLPVLAELYGVTVDEILAGERKAREEKVLSNKAEQNLLRSKLAKFDIRAWILTGIVILALCVVFIGVCFALTDMAMIAVGIPIGVVSIGLIFLFLRNAEISVDDTAEFYPSYCIMLRKKLSHCLYTIAAFSALLSLVLGISLSFANPYQGIVGIISSFAFGVAAVVFFASGWLFYRHALVKYGGESVHQSIRRDRNYFWAVGFWGVFPIVLSIVLIIVVAAGCLEFEVKATVYQNDSVDEFVEYMETLIAPDGERHLPLSELAKNAEIGDKFDLGDGYFAVYHRYSFTIYNEQIMLLYANGDELVTVPYSIEVPRLFIRYDVDEAYYCYNARYYNLAEQTASVKYWFVGQDYEVEIIACPAVDNNQFVEYDYYKLQKFGDGLAYSHAVAYDYSLIGYSVALSVIVADLIVCAALCIWKRNKFTVKL